MTAALHPQYETMFLICNTPWTREQQKETVIQLNNMGFDGEAFYQQHCQVIEKYYQVFEKNFTASAGAEILRNMDIGVLSVCTGVLGSHPDWFETISAVPEQEVGDAVKEVILAGTDISGDYIKVLETEELSDESKWKIIFFQRHAKQQLIEITAAITDNIPAYEKARNKVAGKLDMLLKQYQDNIDKHDHNRLLKMPEQILPGGEIIPTLAFPMVILVNPTTCFYGLLTDLAAVNGEVEFSKEELVIAAKALSDKSKMEILMCLKEKQLCNYEIAECIGLTPATVSHHMSTLLTAGFVELGKTEGKACYTLSHSGIEHYLQGIRHAFLSE